MAVQYEYMFMGVQTPESWTKLSKRAAEGVSGTELAFRPGGGSALKYIYARDLEPNWKVFIHKAGQRHPIAIRPIADREVRLVAVAQDPFWLIKVFSLAGEEIAHVKCDPGASVARLKMMVRRKLIQLGQMSVYQKLQLSNVTGADAPGAARAKVKRAVKPRFADSRLFQLLMRTTLIH